MTKNTNNDIPELPGSVDMEPLMTRPKSIAIVALGLSSPMFLQEQMSNKGFSSPFDEVWAINRGIRGYPCDKAFIMDDLRWLYEVKNRAYSKFVKKSTVPIITSTAYVEYPAAVPYPLQDVLEFIEDDIFTHNTVSYALAYAMTIGCKNISIYGADFSYPNGSTAEVGGQAVAFLLGMCAKLEILHRIPGASTLLYANTVKPQPGGGLCRPHYGYHRIEELKKYRLNKKKGNK